jgi:hypothetical protein
MNSDRPSPMEAMRASSATLERQYQDGIEAAASWWRKETEAAQDQAKAFARLRGITARYPEGEQLEPAEEQLLQNTITRRDVRGDTTLAEAVERLAEANVLGDFVKSVRASDSGRTAAEAVYYVMYPRFNGDSHRAIAFWAFMFPNDGRFEHTPLKAVVTERFVEGFVDAVCRTFKELMKPIPQDQIDELCGLKSPQEVDRYLNGNVN